MMLADPDAWWRETAQRLLVERQDRSVASSLKAMVAARPSATGRLHALWTLDLLSSLDAGSLKLGLADPEPRVREAAIRLAEIRLKSEQGLFEKTLALVGDADPMVRFQLGFSLGEVKDDPRALAALASIATRDTESPWTRTAILSSISGRELALLDTLVKRDGFIATPASGVWLDELAFLVGCGQAGGFKSPARTAGSRRRSFGYLDACVIGTGARASAKRGLFRVADCRPLIAPRQEATGRGRTGRHYQRTSGQAFGRHPTAWAR